MNIGDEALAVVNYHSTYKIVPVTITGVMDSAKSVSINGESKKEIKRYYQVDSEIAFPSDMIPSENVFAVEDKELAKERRNELLGIKSQAQIENEKLSKAKNQLSKIKENGKWETVEDIENTLIDLIKNKKLSFIDEDVDRLERAYLLPEWSDPFERWSNRLISKFF